ncbi:MAG: DNA polymerase III subunit epsilon [Verrucomicrobia bacterium RIFCSPHIGHO2_12_FULL_41_10]|nr:MAG: DNA polymerase III subunit epsilon [Verrucomicrobia bacterium RIFCSPHIGHO2_12_FULL_41_10]
MAKRKGIYYDTETTGTRPGKDRIVELAAYDPEENRTFCTFINPGCPIPPEATAISGITDEMVKEAPPIEEALQSFVQFCTPDIILIAHNNDTFDRLFLEAEGKRAGLMLPTWDYIDTLKWSRKYRPDLPKHALQFLRETFGVSANQAHRALDDCFVLHEVFRQMIDDLSWEQIHQLLDEKGKPMRMPFGKYAGKPLSDIPKDYVSWLSSSGAFDKAENQNLKESFLHLGLLKA